MNLSIAMAQHQPFNPWVVPDSFSVYELATDEVKPWIHPHWRTQRAVHPIWAYVVGMYFLLLGTLAIGGNTMVLRMFARYEVLRTPANVLVMNLTLSDLCLMLSLVPECLVNFFSGGAWRFGEIACQIHAFCGALFGYSQITTLMLISWDRYNVIVNGFSRRPLTYCKVTTLVIFNWIWSLGWAVAPLVGWGYYTLDGMLGTCSFDSYTTDLSNKTHILAACIFQYLLPIIVIIVCYVFIVRTVYRHESELRQQAKKMNVNSLRSNSEQEATSAEIRASKVAIINVTLWIFAWTPFTVVSMLGVFGDTSLIGPVASELPVIMAKTSAVYNPIIYALSHPKYRECLKEMFPWLCIVITPSKVKKAPAPVDNSSVESAKVEI